MAGRWGYSCGKWRRFMKLSAVANLLPYPNFLYSTQTMLFGKQIGCKAKFSKQNSLTGSSSWVKFCLRYNCQQNNRVLLFLAIKLRFKIFSLIGTFQKRSKIGR